MKRAARLYMIWAQKMFLLKADISKAAIRPISCLMGKVLMYMSRSILNKNTHGTGCTLSSAIASNLALGMDIVSAVDNAKNTLQAQ